MDYVNHWIPAFAGMTTRGYTHHGALCHYSGLLVADAGWCSNQAVIPAKAGIQGAEDAVVNGLQVLSDGAFGCRSCGGPAPE